MLDTEQSRREGAIPKRSGFDISKRSVDALRVESKDAVVWDRDLPGFRVRVHRTGRKTYVVQTRGPNGLKRVTIGRHGDTAAEQARKAAAAIIDRIKRGMDPVPSAPVPELTVAGLAERCMSAHAEVNCRPKAVELYRHAIYSTSSELGSLAIGTVDRAQVTALHLQAPRQALSGQPCGERAVQDVLAGGGVGAGTARQ